MFSPFSFRPFLLTTACLQQNLVGVSDSGSELVFQHGSTRPQEVKVHPMETIQSSHAQVQQTLDHTSYRHIYGAHFPAYVKLQEAFLGDVGRAPHLSSSRIALEVFRGDDVDIDFEDWLGDEESGRYDMQYFCFLYLLTTLSHSSFVKFRGQLDPHIAMERKLGIQIKGDF